MVKITPKELVGFKQFASGLSIKEIAAKRSCSTKTVACQMGTLYRKLGITSRTQLTGLALRLGIIQVQDICNIPDVHLALSYDGSAELPMLHGSSAVDVPSGGGIREGT